MLNFTLGVLSGLFFAIVWYQHALKNPDKIAKLLSKVADFESAVEKARALAKAALNK